eukprot:UC1_evm2s1767
MAKEAKEAKLRARAAVSDRGQRVNRSTSMTGIPAGDDAFKGNATAKNIADTAGVPASSSRPREHRFGVLGAALRPWLLRHIDKSSKGFVPYFQKVCGVRPVPQPSDDTFLPPSQSDNLNYSGANQRRYALRSTAVSNKGAAAAIGNLAAPVACQSVDYAETWQDPSSAWYARGISLVLSFLFRFGAFLGYEPFYITVFPFLFWNVDPALGRRVVYMWGMVMYYGQLVKDKLRLPRPQECNARVRCMEAEWKAEFGMPSTHVAAVLGHCLVIVNYTMSADYDGRGSSEYPLASAIFACACVLFCTAFGRVYLGVHSLPDLIGGAAVALVVFFFIYANIEADLDRMVTTSETTLWLPTVAIVSALAVFPVGPTWSNTYGDTAIITGVANGVTTASYLTNSRGECTGTGTSADLPFPWLGVPLLTWITYALLRTLVGVCILGVVRQVLKFSIMSVFAAILPSCDAPIKQRYVAEVPCKFLTYSAVGFGAVWLVPQLYEGLGLT